MTVYVSHKHDALSYIYIPSTTDVFLELQKHGYRFIVEEELQKLIDANGLHDDDVVLIYVTVSSEALRQKLFHHPCRKALWVLDESKSDGVLFRTALELCETIGCRTMVLTYPSRSFCAFLTERGYDVVPFQYLVRGLRSRVEKTHDIIISGQLDAKYYPVRTKIVSLLMTELKGRYKIAFLQHPGFSYAEARHALFGEAYYRLLDECRIGVVCRADWRDRMVLKYFEYGLSWCLPLGDSPSYMNDDMKRSMISFDSLSEITAASLAEKIDDALATHEERIQCYTSSMIESFSLEQNVASFVQRIASL